jgi:Family of unknown function (DUF5681)
MPRYSWPKGESGNAAGRPVGIPNGHAREWFKRLLVAIHRTATIGPDGKPIFEHRKEGEKVDLLTLVADKVMELALDGNAWAIEHIANRLDGKVREQLELTPNRNLKIRYESYEEARAALLEQGVNIDRLPMLTDMRIPEGRDRS